MSNPIDPKDIANVSLDNEADMDGDGQPDDISRDEREAEALRDKLAQVEAERDAALAQNDAASVMARMMKPYADKTFNFVCGYCGVALVLLLLQGWKVCGFYMPESVLLVISGSTAVSVIGLIGIVVGGLFRRG